MSEPTLLVPLSYPLKDHGKRTVRHAIELADRLENAHLYFLHVNLAYKGKTVKKRHLVDAVTREFGTLPNASYHVREAFLLEEAIINEATQQDVSHVIIGKDRKARWRQILAERLDIDVDLAAHLGQHLSAEVVVVS